MGFLEFLRLTKTIWFGNGRHFGKQKGTIEQRLEDPFYNNDAQVLNACANSRGTGKYGLEFPDAPRHIHDKGFDERVNGVVRTLARKINSGTADEKLFPFLEKVCQKSFWYTEFMAFIIPEETHKDPEKGYEYRVAQHTTDVPNHQSHPDKYHVYGKHLTSLIKERDAFEHLYHELIRRASTLESIPYLLQALGSRLVLRDRDLRVRDVSNTLTGTGHIDNFGCPEDYEYWESVNHYQVSLPFAELAESRLIAICEHMQYPELPENVSNAIAIFDRNKPRIIEETFHYTVDI